MNISEVKKQLNISPAQSVIYENECEPDLLGKDVCALLNSGGGFVVAETVKGKHSDFLSIEN